MTLRESETETATRPAILGSGPLFACMLFFSTLFLAMQVYALYVNSRYKWDFIFIMLLWIGVYVFRKRMHLHPAHYLLFGVFMFLHFAGMWGWYQTYPFGLEYDHWVHGFFGFVSSLMVLRTYHHYGVYSPTMIAVATVAVILGFSAFHEIFEYLGALAVGEGEGVLFIGAGDLDEWDTQKDMLNNLIGALIGLLVFHIFYFDKRTRRGIPGERLP